MPTNFPSGVSSYGVPLVPSSPSGATYFVGPVALGGSNGNAGKTPTAPLLTLTAAIALATAGKGDTIYLLPGFTQVLTAAAAVALSKSQVRVIGLGSGKTRPLFTYTTSAAASFDISGAGVYVENVYFAGIGVAAVTAMVNVSAADVTFNNCEFEQADATNGALLGILTTAAAHRLTVVNCRFHGVTTATGASIRLVGAAAAAALDSVRIENNSFSASYGSGIGAIEQITALATNVIVKNNIIINQTASSTKGAVFTSTSTGFVGQNFFGIGSGTAPITFAAGWWGGNYSSAAVATNGTLV